MTDLLIRGACAVDPSSGLCAEADIAVTDGIIEKVTPGMVASARTVIEAHGLVVQPGVIDTHLHLAPNALSLKMAAAAGVTSCIDMTGPAEKVFEHIAARGTGINVAVLNAILPGRNVPDNNPDTAVTERFIDESVESGALGVKLLGGHFPLTPEASARLVERSAAKKVYMAWHAGSTAAGSDLNGLREAVGLAAGNPFHLCHINAYCRGRVAPVTQECDETAATLRTHPEIITESYLSARNGCPLGCDGDTPRSKIVHAQLAHFGFKPDRAGIEAAMLDGVLSAIVERDGLLVPVNGPEGVEAFRAAGTQIDGTFDRVNPALARLYFATARRDDGTFLVDGISTDGGALPRNVILENGLTLTDFSAMTRLEFAAKTSLLPARMLGLPGKGTLAAGTDADLTVYDPVTRRAVHSFVQGRAVLRDGRVCGTGGSVICTAAGEAAVTHRGLTPLTVQGGIPVLDRTFRT